MWKVTSRIFNDDRVSIGSFNFSKKGYFFSFPMVKFRVINIDESYGNSKNNYTESFRQSIDSFMLDI